MNPGPATQNRRIRVFVSSTFRDMMRERDELMTHAWPELRRFCRERQVELVEVDLRWGIAEEQSTRMETLKLCLDEIRACRPFFIGLLGERYGWVPGDDAFTADLREEQPWLKDLHGKSVTELEILHGVLNNPEMSGRAFFYFRDPKYVESVRADKKADFTAENAESAEKQTQLKTLVRATCAAKNIPLRENYPDPGQLGALVLTDLKAAIDAQFPIESIPDPLTREARDHEAFSETRRRTYIGRPDYFEALDRHAAGPVPRPQERERVAEGRVRVEGETPDSAGEVVDTPLVLLGDSGSGKSALLANWLEHWRKAHPRDFIFQHYIGGTPDSAEHWRLMNRLIAEIKRWSDDPEELPKSHDNLLKTFPVWLVKARIKAERDGVRCVLVWDALNQLEDRDHARRLGWLPSHPFTGPLRLVVSTLPGDTLPAVTQRGWKSLRVQLLTPDERRRMIADYLQRFGKKLDASRLERVAATPAAANPLYLKILLDELRITGTHDLLDERLTDYLAATNIPALLKKVLARYQHDYERDRPGLVSEALGLIWAARRGLTETELLRLLKPANHPQLPLAVWTPLRAALEEGLVDRGGILNFAHDFLRTAVATAFKSDQDRQDYLRKQLADYFETEPVTARSCDELPWLLCQANQLDRLRTCLLDIDRFFLIRERDQEELLRYWIWLKEERTMGENYIASFEEWLGQSVGGYTEDGVFVAPLNTQPEEDVSVHPERSQTEISQAATTLASFLFAAALYEEALPLMHRALDIDEKSLGRENPKVATDLSNLAQLLHSTNRLAEAEPLMQRTLALWEESLGLNHPNVASALSNLALLLLDTNRHAEAEPLMRRVLDISEKCFGPEHPEFAVSLNNLARLFRETNRLAEAEPLYRRALAIDVRSFGTEHPNVARDLNNLALLLQDTNRRAEAEPLLRRALDIDEKGFGTVHPNVAVRLNNLALLFQDTNRLAEAEPLMRRALNIDEESYGREHPQVALTLNNLASLLCATNRLIEAEPLLRRALWIDEKSLGQEHYKVATDLNNLAHLLQDTNRRAEAAPLMLRVVDILHKFTRATGHPHPHMGDAINDYVELLLGLGRNREQVLATLREIAPELFRG